MHAKSEWLILWKPHKRTSLCDHTLRRVHHPLRSSSIIPERNATIAGTSLGANDRAPERLQPRSRHRPYAEPAVASPIDFETPSGVSEASCISTAPRSGIRRRIVSTVLPCQATNPLPRRSAASDSPWRQAPHHRRNGAVFSPGKCCKGDAFHAVCRRRSSRSFPQAETPGSVNVHGALARHHIGACIRRLECPLPPGRRPGRAR